MAFTNRVAICTATFLLAAVACTTTKQLASLDVGKSAPGTYALFSFAIEGAGSPEPKCRVILDHKGPDKAVQIYVFPGGKWGLIPLPAGTYAYNNIDCGFQRRYLITNPFGKKENSFSLLPGKINYLGHTTLKFASKDKLDLRFDQQEHLSSLKQLFATLPANSWAAANIVSAYTQRSLRADMMSFELPRKFSMQYQAPKEDQEKLRGVLNTVKTKIGKCADLENVSNPIKAGALQVTYVLKDGSFAETQRRDTHAYSKNFTNCVSKAMSEVKFSASYPVTIDMQL